MIDKRLLETKRKIMKKLILKNGAFNLKGCFYWNQKFSYKTIPIVIQSYYSFAIPREHLKRAELMLQSKQIWILLRNDVANGFYASIKMKPRMM